MKRLRISAVTFACATAVGLALLVPAAGAAGPVPVMTLALTKTTVKVGGQLVSGPVEIATTVSGEPEDNPGLVRLKPGVSATTFLKFVSRLSNDAAFDAIDRYGTIVFSGGDVADGKTVDAFVDLRAGHYIALNNGSGYVPFTVTASRSAATLPTPQATVEAIDFGYHGANTFYDGELVAFRNQGFLIHTFQAFQVASVANARKVERLLLAGNSKAAQKYEIAAPIMLVGPLSSGVVQESVITAPPGVYVMFCPMNAEDGRDYYQLGMLRTLTIK